MSNTADAAIRFALAQVGKPYVWGATGPSAYDCSGLVLASFKAAGYPARFRWTTGTLRMMGHGVKRADLEPGDLVFPDSGHVQIYLGNNKVVEAPHTGANVRVVPMWGFSFARRLTPPATSNYDVSGKPVAVRNAAFNPFGPNPGKIGGEIGGQLAPHLLGPFVGPGPLGDATQSATQLGGLIAWLSDSKNLIRVGMFIGGTAAIFAGIINAERNG